MPVIIDRLDLVDTEADPAREVGTPVPPPPSPAEPVLEVLLTAARRSARVRAD